MVVIRLEAIPTVMARRGVLAKIPHIVSFRTSTADDGTLPRTGATDNKIVLINLLMGGETSDDRGERRRVLILQYSAHVLARSDTLVKKHLENVSKNFSTLVARVNRNRGDAGNHAIDNTNKTNDRRPNEDGLSTSLVVNVNDHVSHGRGYVPVQVPTVVDLWL